MNRLTRGANGTSPSTVVLCGGVVIAALMGCEYSPDSSELEAKIERAEAGQFGTCMDDSYRAGLELEKARFRLKELQEGSPSDEDLTEGIKAADRALELRQQAEAACIREQAQIAEASRVTELEEQLALLAQRVIELESNQRSMQEEILVGVTFETNSATLTPEARTVLDVQADRLIRSGAKVEVAGYASSTGTETHNLDLSERRADSVRKYLIDRGVVPTRLTSKGYGTADPIASDVTEGGRRANQRIELHYGN